VPRIQLKVADTVVFRRSHFNSSLCDSSRKTCYFNHDKNSGVVFKLNVDCLGAN
jgi:hypothetical protein